MRGDLGFCFKGFQCCSGDCPRVLISSKDLSRFSKYLVEKLTLSCPKFIAASVYAHVRSRITSLQSHIT